MYEIQKRSKVNPDVWYMVAHADTREWAGKITVVLNAWENGEFRHVKIEEK